MPSVKAATNIEVQEATIQDHIVESSHVCKRGTASNTFIQGVDDVNVPTYYHPRTLSDLSKNFKFHP